MTTPVKELPFAKTMGNRRLIFRSIESLLNKVATDMRDAESLIDNLNVQGYVVNFVLKDGKLKCLQTNALYSLNQVKVDLVYQIEDPLLGWSGFYIYAIREPIHNIMGVFATPIITPDRLIQ